MKKSDYTKEQIVKSLIYLLNQYPFDTLTITQIVDKANVSRGAFYNNFENIEEALKYAYTTSYKEAFASKGSDINYLLSDEHIKDMVHFFDTNTKLILGIYRWGLLYPITLKQTHQSLEYAKDYEFKEHHINSDYFVIYVCSSYFNTLLYWCLHGKKEDPETMVDMIKTFRKKI